MQLGWHEWYCLSIKSAACPHSSFLEPGARYSYLRFVFDMGVVRECLARVSTIGGYFGWLGSVGI